MLILSDLPFVMHQAAAATGAAGQEPDWLSRHSTLTIGVVGIIVSGFVGPSITAVFSGRRETRKDQRALAVAHQDDLRGLLDEAAQVLSGAVGQLRPLLAAAQAGDEFPKEPTDFLSTLAPLGQRLRLRLPAQDAVVTDYDEAVEKLRAVAKATTSQAAFDEAVTDFETGRNAFLDASLTKLSLDIFKKNKE